MVTVENRYSGLRAPAPGRARMLLHGGDVLARCLKECW
jgi:hypothetical protein